MDPRAKVVRYVGAVRSGELPSCRTIRLACDRWYGDLCNPALYVDWAVLNNFVKFCHEFNHYKGPLSGQPFEPEPWQLFVAANVLCLKYRETGRRKYRQADIEVPRKNGKTFFVAVLSLWLLLFDGESGPEVYTAAMDQAQARLCYEAAETLVMRSIFRSLVKKYNWGLKVPSIVGVMKPLSKDTENKDGLNIFAAICDEVHAWPNTKMMDVIKTGTGARSQPVIFRISTAGVDVSVPYFRDIEDYIKELEGTLPLEEDHFFFLYTPDEGDDWEDEDVWRKLNPNLGVSLSWEYMRSIYNEAKTRGGSYVAAFKTKNLDMWVDAPEVWIPDEDVMANRHEVPDLLGKECYVGIDFASKGDICAVAFWFPEYKAVRWKYFCPQSKVEDSTQGDRVDYRLWRDQGWLVQVPGKAVDEDWFRDYLMREFLKYDIRGIYYDPWGMVNLAQIESHSFGPWQDKLVPWTQSIRYMSVPTKWVESEVLQHNLDFDGDPIARWMFGNVSIYTDPNANVKLDKARSRDKIDGVVALVDAVGGWLNANAAEVKVYEDHDLRILPKL